MGNLLCAGGVLDVTWWGGPVRVVARRSRAAVRSGVRRPDEDLSEADVLASVRAGERDAFADLVRRYAPIAHRTAVLLGAGADADDVVQEAFVKAYRALGSLRDGAPFRPWLLRIVANETKNLHRSTGRRLNRERRAGDQRAAF